MKKYTHIIGSNEFVAKCSADYEEQVNGLFGKLSELNARGPALADGTVIDFGWSRLLIKKKDDVFVIHEPDFEIKVNERSW